MGELCLLDPLNGVLAVIASDKDDSYGKDANNDGSASIPAAGDWNRIQVNSGASSITLQNVLIRYGGGGAGGAMLTMTNSAFGTLSSTTLELSSSFAAALAHGKHRLQLQRLRFRII